MDLCPRVNKDHQGREAKFTTHGAFRKISVKHKFCWCPVLPANVTEMGHVTLTQNRVVSC